MFSYVARQAILDRDKTLFSYELLFKDGKDNCFPDTPIDEVMAKLLEDNLPKLPIEEITGGTLSFINFYLETLLTRFPNYLKAKHSIIEIIETESITPKLKKACEKYKQLGFKIALDNHDLSLDWSELYPFVDFVKVDAQSFSKDLAQQKIKIYQQEKIKLIAKNIDDFDTFQAFYDLGFDYFQGYFFTKPEMVIKSKLPSSKLPLIELISASAAAEFDLEKVNTIIERDVSLSYKLLRFINNPLVNKRNEIRDLRHALNYMGHVEVKKFIALLALANLGDTKSMELIHLSLIRAKFCELIGQAKVLSTNPPVGFLVGLFSLLDALLDQPMSEVVKKLPIGEELKLALCGQDGTLKKFLSLIRAYEGGYWKEVEKICRDLSLNFGLAQAFYHESVKWGHAMKKTVQG